MKALRKSYGFVTCLVFWCALHKVKSVPLDFDLSFPSNDFNQKHTIQTDFGQEYDYVTEDILSNIENHYNESEIVIHSSEDAVDLDNEFKNQTINQNEIFKNDTKIKSYQLNNDKLNQTQTKNDTNYLLHVNDASQTKQSLIHKQGKTKDTMDYYKDKERYKNVRLQTSDDRIETSESDSALLKKEILANVSSTGNLTYEARNDSDTENKEISSHYGKSDHHVKDDTVQKEKNFQGAHFTRTKSINQTNDRRTNSEKEQFTKSGSKDYVKEGPSGLETLQKKCLNHLRQENQYKDQDKEIRRMRKRKNKKRTFFKRMGDFGPKSTWPNWDDFPEDCKDLLKEEINIQNLSTKEEYLNADTVSVPETGRTFDNYINVENSTKAGMSSTFSTPTPSPHVNESQNQNPDNVTEQKTVNVNSLEITTAKDSKFESHSKENKYQSTEKTNDSLADLSEGLNALREKFKLIKKYISTEKDCQDNKYRFSKRLQPISQTKTKSNFTSPLRRAQADPEIIFQDKNITNQTIECIEGEMNCTQDYYEYYYVEQNVYGDEDYSEEEVPSDKFPNPSVTSRQYKGTNTMKRKPLTKKHSPLKNKSILNKSKSS